MRRSNSCRINPWPTEYIQWNKNVLNTIRSFVKMIPDKKVQWCSCASHDEPTLVFIKTLYCLQSALQRYTHIRKTISCIDGNNPPLWAYYLLRLTHLDFTHQDLPHPSVSVPFFQPSLGTFECYTPSSMSICRLHLRQLHKNSPLPPHQTPN